MMMLVYESKLGQNLSIDSFFYTSPLLLLIIDFDASQSLNFFSVPTNDCITARELSEKSILIDNSVWAIVDFTMQVQEQITNAA